MSDDRLLEVREQLGRIRTPTPESPPPKSMDEAIAYLQRLATFLPGFLANIDWLVGEVERLRGLLARLEWSGRAPSATDRYCPGCFAKPENGHNHRCWVAAELTHNDERPRPSA